MRLLWLSLIDVSCLASAVRSEGLDVESDELDALIDDSDSSDLGGGKLDELLLNIENGRPHFRRAGIWKATSILSRFA